MIVAFTFIFFSFEFQEIPTVYYTIYILIMPMAGLSLSMRGWYDKNKLYLLCGLGLIVLCLINGYQYISIMVGV